MRTIRERVLECRRNSPAILAQNISDIGPGNSGQNVLTYWDNIFPPDYLDEIPMILRRDASADYSVEEYLYDIGMPYYDLSFYEYDRLRQLADSWCGEYAND